MVKIKNLIKVITYSQTLFTISIRDKISGVSTEKSSSFSLISSISSKLEGGGLRVARSQIERNSNLFVYSLDPGISRCLLNLTNAYQLIHTSLLI